MTHNEHIQQLQKQLKHAGGFETSLIEAWFKADGDNQRRIEEAFPHDYRIPIGKPPRNGKKIFEDLGWASEKG